MEPSAFFGNTLALRRIIQNHVIPGAIELKDVQETPILYGTMDFGNSLKISAM